MKSEHEKARKILERRWRDSGFDRLLPEERDFIMLWWLEAEVFNGGFHQYFFNSAGDFAKEALQALERLSAASSAAILREAIQLLGSGDYIRDIEARRNHLGTLEREIARFDKVTERLQDLPEEFVCMAIERVRSTYKDNGIE